MILRAVQDSAVMRLSKLRAILGLTIVLTLCVYYPCQDAGAQRPCLRARKLQFENANKMTSRNSADRSWRGKV